MAAQAERLVFASVGLDPWERGYAVLVHAGAPNWGTYYIPYPNPHDALVTRDRLLAQLRAEGTALAGRARPRRRRPKPAAPVMQPTLWEGEQPCSGS